MDISVSVIIPVYNVEEYLAECMDSVLSQSLENIEIICINDCSTDDSSSTLAQYTEKSDKVHIIDHSENQGLAATRNTGLESAKGEYVYFLDSDDLLFSSESLRHLYEIAQKDSADEVIGATLRWYEDNGERLYEHHKEYLKDNLYGVLFQGHEFLRHNAIACNKLLKRSFLADQNIVFNSKLRKFEDNVFSWKTHLQATSISLTVQATYLHRIRSEKGIKSIMQNKENDVLYHTLAAHDMVDFFDNNPQLSSSRHFFDRYILSWCFMDLQEINNGEISREHKKEILEQYLPVLKRIPESSLIEGIMPKRYLEGLSLIKKWHFEEAWEVFAADDYQVLRRRKQLYNIYNSMSWKLTYPLRKFSKFVGSNRGAGK